MRASSLLRTFGVGTAAAIGGTLVGERLLLRRMDDVPAPDGWVDPRWPDGHELMVPADDGAELRVAISGPDDAPPVMLIHGLSGDHHSYGLVADNLLERGHRVIGMNQRGHGGSTVGSEGFGPARQGADVGHVVRALDLDNVVLCGHSMGGVAAMGLMALRPDYGADRVGGLTLVATLAEAVRPDRKWSLGLGDSEWYRKLGAHPIHGPAIGRWIFGKLPSRVVLDDCMAVGERCPDETRHGASVGMIGYDIREYLGAIDVPTHVVCGTDDRLTSHSENEAIAEAIPHARFTSVPDAGHMIIWEAADVVAEAAADTAHRVAARAGARRARDGA